MLVFISKAPASAFLFTAGVLVILYGSLALPVYICSRYVEDGVLDAGICGRDWIVENGADVVEVPWHSRAQKCSAQPCGCQCCGLDSLSGAWSLQEALAKRTSSLSTAVAELVVLLLGCKSLGSKLAAVGAQGMPCTQECTTHFVLAHRCASWRTARPPATPRAGCWPCRRTATSRTLPTWPAQS